MNPPGRRPLFDGMIFDMDGTLTVPTLDFRAIREELGMLSGDLTEEIAKLPAGRREDAWAVIERHEERAMRAQRLQPGAAEVLAECGRQNVKVGLVTRNAQRSVDHLCARFGLTFDAVVTREFAFLKPHPAPILHILKAWRMSPPRALVIGDYVHDLHSGRAAGTRTCFFHNPGSPSFADEADFAIASMEELARMVFPRPGSA